MKKALKIIGIIFLVIILSFIGFGGYLYYKLKSLKDTNDLEVRIEKECNKFIDQKKSVGLAIGVIQGDKIFANGFGYADLENKIPVDTLTIFEIGSISKVFTSEIARILSEQKIIDWNSTIYESLPEQYRPEKDDGTTLLDLVTHTSGYPRLPESLLNKMKDDCNPYNDLIENDFYEYIKTATDKLEANSENYDYSNLGYALLGNILELKVGKSYEELLQIEICKKLNMKYTSLSVNDSLTFANAYDEKRNKTCHWDFPVMYSAGAIRSNINDMLLFAKANLNENPLSFSFKETQNAIYDIPLGKIGKGWHIDYISGKIFGLGNIIWHNGGTGGFRSYIGLLPKSKVAVIVLSNQSGDELDKMAIKILIMAGNISLSSQKH